MPAKQKPPRTLVLDNEAVQALTHAEHPERHKLMGHLEVAAKHHARVVVPVAVRVEAGWDRCGNPAADANRLPVLDRPLTAGGANVAAELVGKLAGLSMAGASVGAVVAELADEERPAFVLSNDKTGMERVAGHLQARLTVGLIGQQHGQAAMEWANRRAGGSK